ncbi:MAG TPA: ribosome silencing factor [candidate division Zixibacteria bacterium]|nr:ribosome silencing factor [candidate division Zixibacteria bacterium]
MGRITPKRKSGASSASSSALKGAKIRVSRRAVKPAPRKPAPPASQALARDIAGLALTKKAFDVTVMDMRGLSAATDFFVLASAATDIQAKAVVRAIADGLRPKGVRSCHVEGLEHARWILMDYVDVVVHVMQPRVRDYYGLEELWADAPREEVRD